MPTFFDVAKPIGSSLSIESPLEFQEYFAEKKREEEKWKARMAIQREYNLKKMNGYRRNDQRLQVQYFKMCMLDVL